MMEVHELVIEMKLLERRLTSIEENIVREDLCGADGENWLNMMIMMKTSSISAGGKRIYECAAPQASLHRLRNEQRGSWLIARGFSLFDLL
ncbi:MAG: hypothetical protein U0401_28270 [Anaerolineae bacterium]